MFIYFDKQSLALIIHDNACPGRSRASDVTAAAGWCSVLCTVNTEMPAPLLLVRFPVLSSPEPRELVSSTPSALSGDSCWREQGEDVEFLECSEQLRESSGSLPVLVH